MGNDSQYGPRWFAVIGAAAGGLINSPVRTSSINASFTVMLADSMGTADGSVLALDDKATNAKFTGSHINKLPPKLNR